MNSRQENQRVLILGTGVVAQMLAQEIRRSPDCGYDLIGLINERLPDVDPCRDFPVLGGMSDLYDVIREQRPHRLVMAQQCRQGFMPTNKLMEASFYNNIIVDHAEALYEKITGKVPIDVQTQTAMLQAGNFRPSPLMEVAARVFSLTVALIGIVITAPLMLLIALAIKLDSGGPVLFVQERIGRHCKSFRLYKFRTMKPPSPDQENGSQWAGDNDHRITRVGRVLRRFRLDELPQFFNILASDMNLVGPRPHPSSNYQMFSLVARNTPICGEQIPYYYLRSMVRPGITGWAQVRYQYANNLNEEIEKLRFDLYYIKHYSLWMDLRILLETLRVVCKGHEVGYHAVSGLRVDALEKPAALAAGTRH